MISTIASRLCYYPTLWNWGPLVQQQSLRHLEIFLQPPQLVLCGVRNVLKDLGVVIVSDINCINS